MSCLNRYLVLSYLLVFFVEGVAIANNFSDEFSFEMDEVGFNKFQECLDEGVPDDRRSTYEIDEDDSLGDLEERCWVSISNPKDIFIQGNFLVPTLFFSPIPEDSGSDLYSQCLKLHQDKGRRYAEMKCSKFLLLN